VLSPVYVPATWELFEMTRRLWANPITGRATGPDLRRKRRWARRVLRSQAKGRILPEANPPEAQPLEDFRFFAVPRHMDGGGHRGSDRAQRLRPGRRSGLSWWTMPAG